MNYSEQVLLASSLVSEGDLEILILNTIVTAGLADMENSFELPLFALSWISLKE
jgi:hypothetical protein